jgi:tRNA(fMet)-specific endonuclease VapC
MISLYLLDTNILIAAIKGHVAVRARFQSLPLNKLRLSAIVLGELRFGAEKSAHSHRNRAVLAALTDELPMVSVGDETIRQYAMIRAHLERQGRPIGANDTWIAAQALAIDAVLVTDNEREFAGVPGLHVENWLGQTG